METPIESEFIEVRSPIDRFKEQWEKQPGSPNFLRQLKVINQSPQSLQYASLSVLKGWAQPLVFAFQGLLLAALLLSLTNWLITKDRGQQADQIASLQRDLEAETKREQGVLEATQQDIDRINRFSKKKEFAVAGSPVPLGREEALQRHNALLEETKKLEQQYKNRTEARQHELHAVGDALALANSGTPLVFSLALLFTAQLMRRGIQKDYGKAKLARQADSFYLYFAVSRGVWINCGLVAAMHLWFSAASYGLSGSSQSIGPILSILFWLAIYGVLIYYFFIVSKDLYKAMQIPVPSNYYSLENKILVRLHNSFWLVFLVFEAGLLILSYGSYLLERHVG
ncbi:MAG TPA: hypothetical protein VG488_00390 [Candidatus Angelobacter sp.]|jgi:hypothetical protein|nr:hypothetical protein [Candidatus Angelobacter sp.]